MIAEKLKKPFGEPEAEENQPIPSDRSSYLDIIRRIFFLFTYDLVIWFFDAVIHTFFRELMPRGTFNIPKKGAVIFVIAPHHNQFVDPVVVMTTVRKMAGRRVSLLTAAKSYRKWFIGIPARMCGAILVERAQDLVKAVEGTISVENFGENNDNLVVLGKDTQFTRDCMEKGLVGLPEFLGNAQIAEVVSDSKLILKKPFKVNFENPTEKDEKIIKRLTEGTKFVAAPHVDNHQVFQNVFDHLNAGRVLGIFPEGGLHDRPTLLPLKPGVAIMALGAVAQSKDPNQIVNIIPVGLNYFHPNKFRSRVVVEFGKPIKVTKKDGAKYEKDSRAVVNKLLDLITLRLKEVTVTCDDYDTLMAIQAARRLYTAAHRETIPLPLVVEMNRRLIKGYQKYSDRPDVKELKDAVGEYNKKLMQLGIHDHQVESLTQSNRLFVTYMFFDRFFKVILFLGLAMPGVIMFGPIFLVAKKISRKKAQEALAASTVKIKAKDVIGTWKILVALGLAPALYIFWAVVATILLTKAGWTGRLPKTVVFILCYLWSVLTTYASLRVGEIGVDYYKSLKPLFYSLVSQHIDLLQLENLQKTRKELAEQVTIVCERFGPLMFDDFNEFYRDFNQLNDNDIDFASVLSYNDSTDLRRNASLNSLSIHNLSDVAIFSNPQDDQESIESDDKHPKPSEENETHSRGEDYAESELPQEKVRLRRVVKRMEET